MAYRVELAARAVRDLEILYLEKSVADSQAAAHWYNGLEKQVSTLTKRPQRCPKIPEMKKTKRDLRHLLYGNKPHVYRIIYEIDVRNKIAWVLHIRHGARRGLRATDLGIRPGLQGHP